MPINGIPELIGGIDEALTIEDLTERTCDCPECRAEPVLMLYPACHPEGRIVAAFDRCSGRLVLACQECRAPYGSFQVAHRVVH
jgi:hypothetical protein